MAITYDNSAIGTAANTTSKTLGLTVGTGSNRLIVVYVQYSTTGGSSPLTAATYGGVNLTSYAYIDDNLQQASCEVLYLLNPPSGANNVSLTSSVFNMRTVGAASYSGVNQNTFPDATGTGSPLTRAVAAANLAANTTSIADNCWGLMMGSVNAAVTAGTNATVRQQVTQELVFGDTNADQTPAGTFTQNWTFSSAKLDAIYFSIAPFAAAVVSTKNTNLSLLGVGQ